MFTPESFVDRACFALGPIAAAAALALTVAAAASATAPTPAPGDGDWPQYRGADGTGISSERGWSSAGKPESVWKTNVGRGYSSVAVSGGRLYTIGHDEDNGLDAILCLDADSGRKLWMHTFKAGLDAKYHGGGTLSTPSIDRDRVYVMHRDGKIMCVDASSGDQHWAKNLAAEHGLERPTWGFSASPLILDDMVVANFNRVFAMDKTTGETKWMSRDFGHAYATPVEFTLNDRECLAVMCGDGLVILDRANGKDLMVYPWKTKYDVNAATPIVTGNRVFISSGYNHGCALVDISGDEPKAVWENKLMKNKMSGCILLDGHLYGFDEKELKCLDLSGNEKWSHRGLGNGALAAADGRLIIMSGDGELIVAKASPESFQELSRAKVLDGGVYWTTPVIAGGRIYCRNSLGDLVCRDHRSGAPDS